jgi:hypothetical protein
MSNTLKTEPIRRVRRSPRRKPNVAQKIFASGFLTMLIRNSDDNNEQRDLDLPAATR